MFWFSPERLIGAARGKAAYYPPGQCTRGMLEQVGWLRKQFSAELLSLARERLERFDTRRLLRDSLAS